MPYPVQLVKNALRSACYLGVRRLHGPHESWSGRGSACKLGCGRIAFQEILVSKLADQFVKRRGGPGHGERRVSETNYESRRRWENMLLLHAAAPIFRSCLAAGNSPRKNASLASDQTGTNLPKCR